MNAINADKIHNFTHACVIQYIVNSVLCEQTLLYIYFLFSFNLIRTANNANN